MMNLIKIIVFLVFCITSSLFSQPVVEWEDNFRDSSGNEYYIDMAFDSGGNIYAVGKSSTRNGDIFLVKYSQTGTKLWVRKYDNSGSTETPKRVFYDVSGYVYVVGITQSGTQKVLTLKYNSSGSLVWANTYSPGLPYSDFVSVCSAFMYAGRIYILSDIRDTYFQKCVLYKINSTGTFSSAVFGPASRNNTPNDITLDNIGNIYVTYYTDAIPSNSSYVSKYSNSLVLLWSRAINDTVNPVLFSRKIALNSLNQVIVSGSTPHDASHRNGRLFAGCFNASDGSLSWYKRFTPVDSLMPIINDMKIDKSNSIILGGYYVLGRTGNTKGMLAVYKHTGSLIRYNIIDSLDVVQSIAVDSISNIYAAGFTNRYNTVHKYNPSGILRWRAVTSQNPFMYKILFAKPDIFYTCGRDRFSPTYKFYFVKFKLNPGSSRPLGETGIAEPNSFRLEENYPNPFNPSTTIRFSVPFSSMTTLKVYDISGREVESLVASNLEAGEHEVDFNASHLASGVYFYRLTSGSFTDVKKMMLVK